MIDGLRGLLPCSLQGPSRATELRFLLLVTVRWPRDRLAGHTGFDVADSSWVC